MGEEVKPEVKEAAPAPEAVPESASSEEEEKKDVAEEKQEAAEEEQPTVEEETLPPPPPPPFILYVDLHCVGCAKKIERSILKIRGVEEVVMDMNENQVTIKGVLDPQAVCNKIKKKTKRMAKVLSPLPAAEGEPLPPTINSQVSGLTTVELNVNMHCQACADQLKKKILKMKGVQTTVTEYTTGKVIVTGTMDEEKLVDYVYRRTKKQARIVPQPDPEPEKPAAEGDKKEESGEGPEKPAEETGGEKKEEEEDGGGEDRSTNSERMTMVKVEEEPRASVEGGCGVGGEEIGGNGTVHGSTAGSVAGEGAEKEIHEARSLEVPSSEPEASTIRPNQLTIFFGGKVRVFDGIPADKIQEIIRIAAAAAKSIETKNSTNTSPVASPALNRAPSLSSTSNAASPATQSFPIHPISFCRSAADLPIARRHSLQRFLEKRRDRLVSKNPYPASDKKTDVPRDSASIEEYPTA